MKRARAEQGVALVMALGFLALFGLLIPALLKLASTNLLVTSRLHEQRAVVYAADGATDAALQYLRTHPACGRSGSQAPCVSTYSVPLNSKSATTTIAPGSYDPPGGTCQAPDITTGSAPVCYYVTLTTTLDGATRVTASVRIWDANTGMLPVDVLSWVYSR